MKQYPNFTLWLLTWAYFSKVVSTLMKSEIVYIVKTIVNFKLTTFCRFLHSTKPWPSLNSF